MPGKNNKKKGKGKGKSTTTTQQQQPSKEEKEFRRHLAPPFRQLLLDARQAYAEGRVLHAYDLQQEALSFGSIHIPRFDENSLTKAHALVELALAMSAICKDFETTGEEHVAKTSEMEQVSTDALAIFHHRLADDTLTKYRPEELWRKGASSYGSPVPHTERLGPKDFLTCTNLAAGVLDPSHNTIGWLKTAVAFGKDFQAQNCILELANGEVLLGDIPDEGLLDSLRQSLQQHEQTVAGVPSTIGDSSLPDGSMEMSHQKLTKDMEKKGLKHCAYPECERCERQPREFGTCSRCNFVAYCGRDHQRKDWKTHKKVCQTEAIQNQPQYKASLIKDKSTLLPGQAQHFMTIVVHLHHFLVTAPALQQSRLQQAPALAGIVAKLQHARDHVKLSMTEISVLWSFLWNIPKQQRGPLLKAFVDEFHSAFPLATKGGPDFSPVLDWNSYAVVGTFSVVEHTEHGSILLHKDDESHTITAYQVVGIAQTLESMIKATKLPRYVNTTLLPYKGLIVTQGTLLLGGVHPSSELKLAAEKYVAGQHTIEFRTTLISSDS